MRGAGLQREPDSLMAGYQNMYNSPIIAARLIATIPMMMPH
jgi:hypothetical protein